MVAAIKKAVRHLSPDSYLWLIVPEHLPGILKSNSDSLLVNARLHRMSQVTASGISSPRLTDILKKGIL